MALVSAHVRRRPRRSSCSRMPSAARPSRLSTRVLFSGTTRTSTSAVWAGFTRAGTENHWLKFETEWTAGTVTGSTANDATPTSIASDGRIDVFVTDITGGGARTSILSSTSKALAINYSAGGWGRNFAGARRRAGECRRHGTECSDSSSATSPRLDNSRRFRSARHRNSKINGYVAASTSCRICLGSMPGRKTHPLKNRCGNNSAQ